MKYYQLNNQTRQHVLVHDHHQDKYQIIRVRNMSRQSIHELMIQQTQRSE